MKKKLNVLEAIVYYWACLVTLGGVWLTKIIIKKAIIEANEQK